MRIFLLLLYLFPSHSSYAFPALFLYAPIRSYQKKNQNKATAGQAFTEYVLILGLVAVLCLSGIKLFTKVMNKYYSNMAAVYTVPIP